MIEREGFPKKRVARRRSSSFWKKVMKDFEESPLSGMAFCHEKNIAYGTFMRRQRAFKNAQEFVPTFIPVQIDPSDPQSIGIPQDKRSSDLSTDWVLKVGSKLMLCIPNDFNEAGLTRLVRVLSAC